MSRRVRSMFASSVLLAAVASCASSEESGRQGTDDEFSASSVNSQVDEDPDNDSSSAEPTPAGDDASNDVESASGRPTALPNGFPGDCGSDVVPLVHVAKFADGRFVGVDSRGSVLWESAVVTDVDLNPVHPQTNDFYVGERQLLDLGQRTVVDEYDGDFRFQLPDCSAIYDGIGSPLQLLAPNGFRHLGVRRSGPWELRSDHTIDGDRRAARRRHRRGLHRAVARERRGAVVGAVRGRRRCHTGRRRRGVRRREWIGRPASHRRRGVRRADFRVRRDATRVADVRFDAVVADGEDAGPSDIGGVDWYDLSAGELFAQDSDITEFTLYLRGGPPSSKRGIGAVVSRDSGVSIVPDCSDPGTEFAVDGLNLAVPGFTAVASDQTVAIGNDGGLAIVDSATGELLFESGNVGAELVRDATGDAYVLHIGNSFQFFDDRTGAVVGTLDGAEFVRTLLAPPGVDAPIVEAFTTEAPGTTRLNAATGELLAID